MLYSYLQIPSGGVKAFPANRYILKDIKAREQQSKSHDECPKHKGQPLILFCDEKQCQMMICWACDRTGRHKGHKMVEIDEKADEIKKKVQEFNKNSQKIKDVFDEQITTITEVIENINTTTSTGTLRPLQGLVQVISTLLTEPCFIAICLRTMTSAGLRLCASYDTSLTF